MKPEGVSKFFATAAQHLPMCVCVCVCVHHIMGWVGIIMFVRYTGPQTIKFLFFCGSGGLEYAEAGGLCTDAVSCCDVCKYVNISTTAVQHLRNKTLNQPKHTYFEVHVSCTAVQHSRRSSRQPAYTDSTTGIARGFR